MNSMTSRTSGSSLNPVVPRPSALAQLRFLSDDHPSYASLAQILSERRFERYDIASRTEIGRLRAHGGYADVYDGLLLPPPYEYETSAEKVAIKRFRIFLDHDKDFAKAIANEIRAWLPLDHPNVLPFLGFTVVEEAPCLVSPWMEKGCLRQYIRQGGITSLEREELARKIAAGLVYLHGKGIIHGDVKGDNILIDRDGCPKLADFGIARVAIESGASGSTSMTGQRGSVRWTAVELWEAQMGQRTDSSSSGRNTHTKKADVWAFGMVVYELLSGDIPYSTYRSDMQVMFAIVNGELPEKPRSLRGSAIDYVVTERLWYICSLCWTRRPKERPSLEDIWEEMYAVRSLPSPSQIHQRRAWTGPPTARQLRQTDSNDNELLRAVFPFMGLPTEIILKIMEVLPACDVIALCMINRAIHHLSRSHSLWITQARTHLALSRPLVFPNNISNQHKPLPIVPLSTLRTAILNSTHLSQAWSRSLGAPVAQPSFSRLKILRDNDQRTIMRAITRVTPRHVLVLRDDVEAGHNAQELIGWDVRRDRCVGRVRLGRMLVSAKLEWTTGNYYAVTGRCLDLGEFEFAIMRVQIRETAVQICDSINNTNNHTTSPALIDKSATTAGVMTTDILARFVIPNSVGIDVHTLDVQARTAVVLFDRGNARSVRRNAILRKRGVWTDDDEPSVSLGLVIIFDWATGLSAEVDTGIPFDHCTTSASLHLTPGHSHLIVRTEESNHVAGDASAGRNVVLRIRQKLLDLDQLKQRAKSWDETIENLSRFAKFRNGGRGATNQGAEEKRVQSVGTCVDYEWGGEVAGALVDGSGTNVVAAVETHSVPTAFFGLLSRFVSTSLAQPLLRTPTLGFDEIIRTWVLHEDWPSFHEIDGRASPSTPYDADADPGTASSMQPIGVHTSARSSRISLYSRSLSHGTIGSRAGCGRIWYLVQSYVESLEADTTVPPSPAVVCLNSPVLLQGAFDLNRNSRTRLMPLMDVSFNYACWLEDAPEDMAASVPAKLVPRRLLKLASFRGPEDTRLKSLMLDRHVCSVSDGNRNRNEDKKVDFASVTTLDIPKGDTILCDARYLFLSETEGTISFVFGSGGMYTYSFVR